MNPVKTERTNLIYGSSDPEIGELPGEDIPGGFRCVWKPTELERQRIFGGDNIELYIMYRPIPPVSLGVTSERVVG